jgi:hypothetical protein
MASTFTTNFAIEKPGTGEQSGTWGTTTNHNFDIFDRLAGYKSVTVSGTTHTLTVRPSSPSSGSSNASDGMYRVIEFKIDFFFKITRLIVGMKTHNPNVLINKHSLRNSGVYVI